MRVIKEGHIYELDNFDNPANKQIISFICKQPKEDNSGELELVFDGTTNEEILAMLIDRLAFLYEKLPDADTSDAIEYCVHALETLELRTRKRKERGVEGTHKP